jgi:hypothetical protein
MTATSPHWSLAMSGELDLTRYFYHPRGGQKGERMGMYVAVPRMLNYTDVPLPGREVYRALCAFADNATDLAQVGHNRIAIEAGISRRAAVTWTAKLDAEYGLIETVRRSRDRVNPNVYRVLYPKDWPPRYRDQLLAALRRIQAGSLDGGKVTSTDPEVQTVVDAAKVPW